MALTAGVREGLDAGMFANFPGGLISKSGTKQNTMDLRPGPGQFVPIDTNGGRIQDSAMAIAVQGNGSGHDVPDPVPCGNGDADWRGC